MFDSIGVFLENSIIILSKKLPWVFPSASIALIDGSSRTKLYLAQLLWLVSIKEG